eukprot:TRINITY_DN81518_c0_g1_i1.p1 TRINITY_DN81518_c0_g1~~TRINITY_DN81518_c0_g1_i1.p1  ORF type:complete len:110 (-),score=24.90 TRINITY_DN81518_c0_g1_i1:54-383(-)
MAKRSSSSLLALALVGTAMYALLPSEQESFVAPQASRSSSMPEGTNAGALAQASSFKPEARAARVSMAATGGPPSKINLLYLGLLVGTAAIGLLSLFFYGSYSGAGSGL